MVHFIRATAARWDQLSLTHTLSKAEQLLIWKPIVGGKQMAVCEKPLKLAMVSWSKMGRSIWKEACKWYASEEKSSRTNLIVR